MLTKVSFWLYFSLILGQNSVQSLSVTKNIKEVKFEGVSGELEKKVFRDKNSQNL